MYMDKVKNLCDYGKILWEIMAANQKPIGTLWRPPHRLELKYGLFEKRT